MIYLLMLLSAFGILALLMVLLLAVGCLMAARKPEPKP